MKRILVIIVTVLFIFCAVSMAVTKFVYDGIFSRCDTSVQIPQALSETVAARQVCAFPSGENLLTGYYYAPPETVDKQGLILFVPGFCASADSYLWQIQALTDYGWGVFSFDTTGTFSSQGENQVGFSQSVPDLEAALKYVENNRRFGYNKLVLMGHSRGAYAVCSILSQNWDVAAVVSVSGVNSAMDAVMEASRQKAGIISYGNYGFLWLYQALLFGTDTLGLQASESISGQDVPVLLIHGTKDTRIPLSSSSIHAHREEISADCVEYLLLEAGHTDLLFDADGTANDALFRQIHEFLIRNTEK